MKKIPLKNRKKEIIDFAIVDDEDYDRVKKYRWHRHLTRGKKYARHNFWKKIKGRKRCLSFSLHQKILGKRGNKEIDHLDSDGLNCQKKNLRFCTHGQNVFNTKRKGKITGFRGVGLEKRKYGKKKWRVYISFRRKHLFIGCFFTKEEAARAYDVAARKYHGDFAQLNFPPKGKK
jgi:hypothetical protein